RWNLRLWAPCQSSWSSAPSRKYRPGRPCPCRQARGPSSHTSSVLPLEHCLTWPRGISACERRSESFRVPCSPHSEFVALLAGLLYSSPVPESPPAPLHQSPRG